MRSLGGGEGVTCPLPCGPLPCGCQQPDHARQGTSGPSSSSELLPTDAPMDQVLGLRLKRVVDIFGKNTPSATQDREDPQFSAS